MNGRFIGNIPTVEDEAIEQNRGLFRNILLILRIAPMKPIMRMRSIILIAHKHETKNRYMQRKITSWENINLNFIFYYQQVCLIKCTCILCWYKTGMSNSFHWRDKLYLFKDIAEKEITRKEKGGIIQMRKKLFNTALAYEKSKEKCLEFFMWSLTSKSLWFIHN